MLDWAAILTQFPPWEGSAEPESYRDFLGVRTRIRYYPPAYRSLAGTVQGMPGPDRAGLHDVAEWAGVLQSVLEAERQFVCVELGAGYGPFVVGSAIAARRRGITDIRLIAVEGSRARAEWILEHMRDNGIDPDQHTITRGVIGTFDGFAHFPILDDNPIKSDAEPNFAAASQENMERVPSYTIGTVLKDLKFVNIVHFDVQGGEADVIRNSLSILTEKCRRMVIGTHSLAIEDDLRSMLSHNGWAIEADEACKLSPEGWLAHDGVQVWRNDRLSSAYPDKPQARTFSGLLRRIFAGS